MSTLKETNFGYSILLAEAIINATGRIDEVHVLRSVAPAYDNLVLEQLESAVYEPARKDGQPVAVCLAFTSRPEYH